jgi:hypothetical protein
VRKSTDLWIKDDVRARLFRGTRSRRARPATGAVGGDQLLRISSPCVPRFQQARPRPPTMLIGGTGQERTEADHRALLGETGFSLTRLSPTAEPLSIMESRSSLPRRAERDEVRESSNGSGPYLRSLRETSDSRSALWQFERTAVIRNRCGKSRGRMRGQDGGLFSLDPPAQVSPSNLKRHEKGPRAGGFG